MGTVLSSLTKGYNRLFGPIHKQLLLVIGVLIISVGCSSPASQENTEIRKMINRLAPDYADEFRFVLVPDSVDFFELESKKGKVVISGNNTNSLAVGLNHYFKYYCNTSISWYANDPVQLPEELPVVTHKIHRKARVDKRFFLNYCTFGYSMPWWQWRDWERFIDWMALNGINMPLAITGQEAIWYKVWQQFGLNDQQIREYFTGPAHLPWHRMSNLDHWGGPLPHSWLDHQLELQKKILKRERELGMKPVLPAFAGHVPGELRSIYPEAKISKLGFWGGFEDAYRSEFLDPFDPLFPKIQKAFLEEQTRQFGTDHIYGADPFNEVEPPSWEPEYLANVSNTIYKTMTETDPSAQWVQMSWIFYFERKHWTNERIEAMLKAVPNDRMVLLDYYCENKQVWPMTDSFYGQPYIWCYLGNFGGNTMLAGNLAEVDKRIENTFQNGGDNMNGLGSTLEALDVNPLMYEFVFEKAWNGDNMPLDQWMRHWADRRCGDKDDKVQEAWEVLLQKIYKYPARLGQATLTNARPSFNGSGNWTTDPHIDYNNKELFQAWELLLEADNNDRNAYQYDVVNIGRQVLGNHFMVLRDQFTASYKDGELEALKRTGQQMMDLLNDLDGLLATHSSFLLGRWIEEARAMGADEAEADYYENNARNIITTWGGKAQSLNDYANRSWAGLTKGFYAARWEMFVNDVIESVEKNESFDEAVFFDKVTKFETDWVDGNEKYNSRPVGNSNQMAKQLLEKYREQILGK
ncbi:alpha-N-acetylglucosaminidase [Marinilabiliaceae bacterium JC017]|nr:alpha-N-acetylglucosaminidase [Marinilabiliaceae bacterium JC017]